MNDALQDLKVIVETSTEMTYNSPYNREKVTVTFKHEVPQYEVGTNSRRKVGTLPVDAEKNKERIRAIVETAGDSLRLVDDEGDKWTIEYSI